MPHLSKKKQKNDKQAKKKKKNDKQTSKKKNKKKPHCCSTTVYFPLGRLKNWLDPLLQCLWRFINVPNEHD